MCMKQRQGEVITNKKILPCKMRKRINDDLEHRDDFPTAEREEKVIKKFLKPQKKGTKKCFFFLSCGESF